MVRREAIGLQQHLIVNVEVIEGDVSTQFIAEGRRAIERNLQPHSERLAGGEVCVYLLLRKIARAPSILRWLLGGELRPSLGLELFRCFECAVRMAGVEQFLAILAVDFGALGLTVGAMRAADIRAFVPVQADPAQRLEDHLLAGRDEPGTIRVLNAQHKLSAALGGEEVIQQTDVSGADMGVAGGRGGDTDTDRARACGGGRLSHWNNFNGTRASSAASSALELVWRRRRGGWI